MSKITAFFSLIRVNNLFIALIAILESTYLLDAPISFQTLVLIIVILSFMSSGYIVNDILDQKTDLINNKKKPLITNLITKKTATLLNCVFLLLGIVCSFFLNNHAQAIVMFILFPLLYLYNYYLKRYFLFGNLVVAFLIGMIFIITELEISSSCLFLFPIACSAFYLNLIREIIKDIEDVDGDLQDKMTTLPILWGQNLSIILLRILILLFIFFSLIYLYTQLIHLTVLIILFILLIEFPLLYSLFLLRRLPSKKTIYNLSKLYKVIVFNGLLIIPMMKG